MLNRAIKLQPALKMMALSKPDLSEFLLSAEESKTLATLCALLPSLEEASDLVCSSSYPTLLASVPAYDAVFKELEDFINNNTSSTTLTAAAATASKEKPSWCYSKADQIACLIVTILDPCFRTQYYTNNGQKKPEIRVANRAPQDPKSSVIALILILILKF